ncbi:MAG TPA: hypothetical protein VJY12_02680, partial [Dysgonamonadaceae bacterium]|nr:hypothetical protein [Dysgonamonadaceae bacterium]
MNKNKEVSQMESKDMNYDQVKERLDELKVEFTEQRSELNKEQVDSMREENKSLKERMNEFKLERETRDNKIKEALEIEENNGDVKIIAEKRGDENKMNKEQNLGYESVEYRNAFLKNLMGQDLTEVEERA